MSAKTISAIAAVAFAAGAGVTKISELPGAVRVEKVEISLESLPSPKKLAPGDAAIRELVPTLKASGFRTVDGREINVGPRACPKADRAVLEACLAAASACEWPL